MAQARIVTRSKKSSLHRSQLLYKGAIIDAHNHVGMDIEGVMQEPQSLLRKMEQSHVEKCIIFPFNEVKPRKAFSAANDYIAKVTIAHPDKLLDLPAPTHVIH